MSRQFVLVIILLCIITFLGINYFSASLAVNFEGSREVLFIIENGESVTKIVANLRKEGLINSKLSFKFYVFLRNLEDKFQAGEYELYAGMNMEEIIEILISPGKILETKITVIEGWDSNKIAGYLQKRGLVEKSDFLEVVNNVSAEWLAEYEFLKDKPTEASLEGYLFPDTYQVYREPEIKEVVEKMLDNFDKKLNKELRQEIKRQGKSIFEILIMASLIEKEVPKDKDRKIVADVFYKRLKIGKALESCATINYILGNTKKRLSFEDTRIKSPYNTYINPGLPIGPICSPSLSAIRAAIYPQKTDYWYFLSKTDGTIVFSKTNDEHSINKAKYLK